MSGDGNDRVLGAERVPYHPGAAYRFGIQIEFAGKERVKVCNLDEVDRFVHPPMFGPLPPQRRISLGLE